MLAALWTAGRPARVVGAQLILGSGGAIDADRGRRAVALALPVVVPVAMRAVFAAARDRVGTRRGYVAGFVTYWATCAVLASALVGPPRIGTLVARRRRADPGGRVALLVALAWPPAGAIATRFLPDVRRATPAALLTTALVAGVNAPLEELLWRGAYVSLWPNDPLRGWVWPALGFGAWHAAPQVIRPARMGSARYVAAATALGLSWGWAASRAASLRWVVISHLLTDGSGLRNAEFFIGPRAAAGPSRS